MNRQLAFYAGAAVDALERARDSHAKLIRPAIRERDVKRYLVKRAKALGGELRKVVWEGRRNAPDWLVMLPPVDSALAMTSARSPLVLPARTIWVELKAPGEKPTTGQLREHARMRALGQRVEVVDSFQRVDEVLS